MRLISNGRNGKGTRAAPGLSITSPPLMSKPATKTQDPEQPTHVTGSSENVGVEVHDVGPTTSESAVVENIASAIPPEVEPILTSLEDGEYKVRGGWNLTVAGSTLRIEVATTASHAPGRVSAGNIVLTNGPSKLIIAFGTSVPEAAETAETTSTGSAVDQMVPDQESTAAENPA